MWHLDLDLHSHSSCMAFWAINGLHYASALISYLVHYYTSFHAFMAGHTGGAVNIEKYVVHLLLILLPEGTHHIGVQVHNCCTSLKNIDLAQTRTILEMYVMKEDGRVVS